MWKQVLALAGFADNMYLTVRAYADDEAVAIVTAAADLLEVLAPNLRPSAARAEGCLRGAGSPFPGTDETLST